MNGAPMSAEEVRATAAALVALHGELAFAVVSATCDRMIAERDFASLASWVLIGRAVGAARAGAERELA